MPYVQRVSDSIAPWAFTRGIYIVLILFGALLVVRVSDVFIRRLFLYFSGIEEDSAKRQVLQRRNTLLHIFQGTFKTILWTIAIVSASSEAGISIAPILAAAGAAGLAIGFGGQYLARDLITGFFMTLENQYRVGDYVCFDKTCGYVEDITLRMTTLRDFDGVVYHVPNGSVIRTANYSKDFSRVYLDFTVTYDNDMQKVIAMINEVGKGLYADPVWKPRLRSAPSFLRVDAFVDAGMTLKIIGRTAPGKQWDVSGELRLRLKVAADKEGIHLPRNFGYYTAPPMAGVVVQKALKKVLSRKEEGGEESEPEPVT